MPLPNTGLTSKDLCNGAAIERVLGDASVTSVKISAHLESDNFSSGSAGWEINRDTGDAEFNDITVRGTIYATAGEIGGLSVEDNITMGSGVIRSASSGLRYELGATGTYAKLDFYSGDGSETSAGVLRLIAGASPLMVLKPPTITGKTVAMLVGGDTITLTADGASAQIGTATGNNVQLYDGAGVTLTAYETGDQVLLWVDVGTSGSDGTASAPALSFVNDPDTGMYRNGANRLAFSIGGTHVAEFNMGKLRTATLATGSPEILFGSSTGSATDPVYSFQGDSNTGMYRSTSDVLAWTTGGTARMTLSNTELTLAAGTHYLGQPSTTGSAANATWVVASGSIYRLYRSTSAAKYKTDIRDADLADVVLKPRRYWSLLDESEQVGFIADEVAEVLPTAASRDEAGEIENYDTRAVMAVLAAKVNRLEQEVQEWNNQ